MEDQKKRSHNFSYRETNLLIELVKTFKHIVENKRTDTVSFKQKSDCWKRITEEFNLKSADIYRSNVILKKKWENLKKGLKKKVADGRMYTGGTDGGPEKEVKLTAMEEEIKSLIEVQATGLPSTYDSDRIEIENIDNVLNDSNIIKWDTYNPNMLKLPVSDKLMKHSTEYFVVEADNVIENVDLTSQIEVEDGTSTDPTHTIETDETSDLPKLITSVKVPKMKRGKNAASGTLTNAKWCALADSKRELVALQIEEVKIKITLAQNKLEFQKEQKELELEILRRDLQIRDMQLHEK